MNGSDTDLARRIAELPLRDIHLPDPVGVWPLSLGWWVVIASVVLLSTALILAWRWWSSERWRRAALEELDVIARDFADDADASRAMMRTSTLTRRVCLQRFDRERCAGLTGNDWLSFLRESAPGEHFQGETGEQLVTGVYRPAVGADVTPLLSAIRQWIAALEREAA